eukprot:Colp12_sorted_trinity150504_noHs@71
MTDLSPHLNTALAVLYSILFLICVFQLCRIFYFRHKKASYQTYFLALCLVWTVIRAIFLGFCYRDWVTMPSWLLRILYWLPINVQFATYSLVVLYFAQVVHKHDWEKSYKRMFYASWIVVNILLIIPLIAWMIAVGDDPVTSEKQFIARQVSTAVVFFILVIILAVYGFKLSQVARETTVSVGVKKIGGTQVQLLIACIIFLFSTRVIYNILSATGVLRIAVTNAPPEEAIVSSLLFVFWEIIPIASINYFFRESSRPRQTGSSFTQTQTENKPSKRASQARNLFQNPNRYDALDEEQHEPLLPQTASSSSPNFFTYHSDAHTHMGGLSSYSQSRVSLPPSFPPSTSPYGSTNR